MLGIVPPGLTPWAIAVPPLLRLEGHNHFSPPCSLGTSDDELGGAIMGFVWT